uniref:Nipsnap homolog 3B n=1 Tax=Aotus nancymaae TaxID=37293 RepID=A0A2K5CVG1_AOTNA
QSAGITGVSTVCSSFATGPRQYNGTFYEFCPYYFKPSKMNTFMENLKENIHIWTAHSELVGFWCVEFGAEVRKALANCKEWQEQALIPNLAHVDKQESEITYLTPWSKLEKPPKEVHVLWWNESADSHAAGRHKSHEDPRVVACFQESVNYLVSQQNMLLIPTAFSPLKIVSTEIQNISLTAIDLSANGA